MKFFKKADLIIIALILAFACVFYFIYSTRQKEKGTFAQIYYKNALVFSTELLTGEERVFSLKEAPNVVFRLYEDGAICFLSSDCPDKICVKTGRIHEVGQMAACLPNGLVLKIVSTESGSSNADIALG